MEQRNMTLQAKTERLERELRVMGDRLRTLETRNKDLEAATGEEWVSHLILPKKFKTRVNLSSLSVTVTRNRIHGYVFLVKLK